MTFQDAIDKATETPDGWTTESEAIDRLTHAVVALALAMRDRL